MNYIEECLEKFNNLPQELQDYLNSEKSIKTLEEIEKDFGVDLTLALVLIFINELDLEDLSIYIQEKYKTDNATTNQILFKLEDGILKEIIEGINDSKKEVVERDYILDLDFSEKKTLIFSIFSEKIIEQFQTSEEHLFRLNAAIFEVIGEEESFLDRINRALLDNKEKISDKFIVTKGKTLDSNISNWIKDYVTDQGSDMVTAVSLAKYLSTNANVKKLDQEEKQILRQILKIYKNLAFFPESMGNAPYKDWEIFPINRDILSFYINKKRKIKTSEDKKEKTSPVTSSIKVKKDNAIEDSLVEAEEGKKEEIKEEIKEDKKDIKPPPVKTSKGGEVDILKEILKKYPKNNLERKAIEAEIKKLEKK